MKTLPIVFATVLASSLVSATHAAAPAGKITQRVVSFADLDLRQNADAASSCATLRRSSASQTTLEVTTKTTLQIRAGLLLCGLLTCAGPACADAVTDWNEITMAAVTAARPGPVGMLDVALVQVARQEDANVQPLFGRGSGHFLLPVDDE